HAATHRRLSRRVPRLEHDLVLRLVHLSAWRGYLLRRGDRGVREEARCRQQSLGCRRHHAGMDAVVATTVPSVRNATADQIGAGVWTHTWLVCHCGAWSACQLVRCGAARLYDLLLRRDLHGLAQALDLAEHRDRWRRRCFPADDRLGSSHRLIVL